MRSDRRLPTGSSTSHRRLPLLEPGLLQSPARAKEDMDKPHRDLIDIVTHTLVFRDQKERGQHTAYETHTLSSFRWELC